VGKATYLSPERLFDRVVADYPLSEKGDRVLGGGGVGSVAGGGGVGSVAGGGGIGSLVVGGGVDPLVAGGGGGGSLAVGTASVAGRDAAGCITGGAGVAFVPEGASLDVGMEVVWGGDKEGASGLALAVRRAVPMPSRTLASAVFTFGSSRPLSTLSSGARVVATWLSTCSITPGKK
jgi:hypothetical protein